MVLLGSKWTPLGATASSADDPHVVSPREDQGQRERDGEGVDGRV
ncbi:hypothetical protein ACIBEA_05560 [Streptomyces sp. NPDC051555]